MLLKVFALILCLAVSAWAAPLLGVGMLNPYLGLYGGGWHGLGPFGLTGLYSPYSILGAMPGLYASLDLRSWVGGLFNGLGFAGMTY